MSAQGLGASSASLGDRDPAAAPALSLPRREPLEWVGFAALLLLAPAVQVYLSFNAGGYFPVAPGFVAILLAQALVVRTILAPRPFEGYGWAVAVPLAALALYAGWELASNLWSHTTARTLDGFDRTLVYLLAFALFGSLRRTRARVAWLIRAVTLGLVVVCLIGLTSRVLPHVWPTSQAFFAERLNYPLTYWNAEGMLAALALILGLHLSADPAEPRGVRVLAAAVLPALAATLLLTFSRGALGVAAIGILAYCLLARLHTLPGALIAAAPTVAIALHSAWDATLLAGKHPTSPAAIHQGHHVALVVGACMLAAAVLRALLLIPDHLISRIGPVRRPPRLRVRAGIGAAVAILVVAVALAAGAGGQAHRQYDKFVHGTHEHKAAQTRERLTDPANDGRLPLWKAALDIFDTDKLHGTGAGTYQQYYPRYRSEATYVSDAHSLYLQTLAELGIVGLALLLVCLLGILAGLGARIRGSERAVYAALFAAVLAALVHQAFDWDWQMPAVTLPVFMLAGLALARPQDGRVGMRGLPVSRTVVALGWLVLAVSPLLVSLSYSRLQDADRSLRAGNCSLARKQALSSLSVSAKRPQAYTIIGLCDMQEGFAPAAVSAMRKAVDLEPHSWEDRYWVAVADAAAGSDPRPALREAHALNPLESLISLPLRELRPNDPRGWEARAPGLRRAALSSGKFTVAGL